MVGCVVLLLLNVADIQVRTDTTALGIPLHIGRPDTLQWALLCAVTYWAIRFYQYQGGRQFSAFNVATWDTIRKYLDPYAIDYIVPARPTFEKPQAPEGSRLELRSYDVGMYSYEWRGMRASVDPTWFIYKPGEEHPQMVHTGQRNVLFKGPLVWKALAIGYLRACVRTPAFTDHYLPYVLFVISVAFALNRLLLG